MSLDAMKQALEVLSLELPIGSHLELKNDLRAAIEQAQGKHEDWCASLTQLLLSMPPKPAPCNCKSKTASPRQWQGLTDEEITKAGHLNVEGERMLPYSFARAIEAKLREKNT